MKKKGIELDGKRLTKKDILAMSKHPKTIAFFDKGKSLLNGSDLSIMDKNTPKKAKKRAIVKTFRATKIKLSSLSSLKSNAKKAVKIGRGHNPHNLSSRKPHLF